MPIQEIVNKCPYLEKKYYACPDYKESLALRDYMNIGKCINHNDYDNLCSCDNPKELLGYNLSREDVSKHTKRMIKNAKKHA